MVFENISKEKKNPQFFKIFSMSGTDNQITQKLKPITKEYLSNVEKCQETIIMIDDEMRKLIESID